jgi:hypothetical protein
MRLLARHRRHFMRASEMALELVGASKANIPVFAADYMTLEPLGFLQCLLW